MAPHSSTLAWKIPWMEEPGGLQSMGSLGVGHDWATSRSHIGEGNGNPLHVLAWRIPGTGEHGGLPSMGSNRVGHDWSDLAAELTLLFKILNLSKIINKTPKHEKKKSVFYFRFFTVYWVQTCSFSRRPAFSHWWLLLHSWCLKSRMFSPPSKLKINELPHHERLGNANGCQNSNSENTKK